MSLLYTVFRKSQVILHKNRYLVLCNIYKYTELYKLYSLNIFNSKAKIILCNLYYLISYFCALYTNPQFITKRCLKNLLKFFQKNREQSCDCSPKTAMLFVFFLGKLSAHKDAHYGRHHKSPCPAAGIAEAMKPRNIGIEILVHFNPVAVKFQLG